MKCLMTKTPVKKVRLLKKVIDHKLKHWRRSECEFGGKVEQEEAKKERNYRASLITTMCLH